MEHHAVMKAQDWEN